MRLVPGCRQTPLGLSLLDRSDSLDRSTAALEDSHRSPVDVSIGDCDPYGSQPKSRCASFCSLETCPDTSV